MQQEPLRLSDTDARRLKRLVAGPRPRDRSDAGAVSLLERRIDEAQILPEVHIERDVVTMGSRVVVRDLCTHEAMTFRIVLPGSANPNSGTLSVLSPLGIAVLGRRAGDHVTCPTPGGLRRLRVDHVAGRVEQRGEEAP